MPQVARHARILAFVAASAAAACGSDSEPRAPATDGGRVGDGALLGTGGAAAGGGPGSGGAGMPAGGDAGIGSGAAGGAGGAGGNLDTSGGATGGGRDGTGGRQASGGDGPEAGAGGSAEGAREVRIVGRHERNGSEVRFSWSGTGLRFRFEGTGATVRLDDPSGFFTVVVDGTVQDDLRTMPGARDYALADNLPSGEHEVGLYRRTEAHQGVTTFLGARIEGGALAALPAPTRRIEVIGDSLTCGYGNEGAGPNCPYSPATENHYLAYAAIAARKLDAELYTVAWSGKGVVYNYGDDKNEPMPALYDRAIGTEGGSTWDFSAWQADVVVVNLGTNDFSTDDDPSEMVFKNAYRALLERVRAAYPDATILCLAPTGLGEPDFGTAAGYIADVVASLASDGDRRVFAHELQFTSTGWGCDYHPSVATHEAMAAALASEIETLVGW